MATASADKTARLWDARTGQPFGAPLVGHTDAVSGVAFSPDGNRLATARYDKTARIWPVNPSPDMLYDKLSANMSHKQWREWISSDIDYSVLCPGLPISAD